MSEMDFDSFSMLDLFKMELETHTALLEAGLLQAEKSEATDVESLMRAAHSIKGAARIVGLTAIVPLAHQLEDFFNAMMFNKSQLSKENADTLFEINDFFKSLISLPEKEIEPYVASLSNSINLLLNKINNVTVENLGPEKSSSKVKKATKKKPIKKEELQPPFISNSGSEIKAKNDAIRVKQGGDDETSVRLKSHNLSKILGLAGEIKIQSGYAQSFSSNLLMLKNYLSGLNSESEQLLDIIRDESKKDIVQEKIEYMISELAYYDQFLSQKIEQFDSFSIGLTFLGNSLNDELVKSRMRPFNEISAGLPRYVRDLTKKLNKAVSLTIVGDDTLVDSDILDKLEAPISHLISNAIDHGIEEATTRAENGKPEIGSIVVTACHRNGLLNISIADDGAGIDIESIRKKCVKRGYTTEKIAKTFTNTEVLDFLFLPGFSTKDDVSEVSGRGMGLDIVQSIVQKTGGAARIETTLGTGTTFILQLPITLSILKTLVFSIADELYALPLTTVEKVLKLNLSDLEKNEDRLYYVTGALASSIINATEVLGVPSRGVKGEEISVVFIKNRIESYGLIVDSFFGERDLVVLPLDSRLGKIPNVSAAAIIETGEPLLILDREELINNIDNMVRLSKPDKPSNSNDSKGKKSKRILVVDDSITVREVEKKLLEKEGYLVITAVDGIDGYNVAQSNTFDLIITDVDMPRMNGIDLVKQLKNNVKLKDIPVMIVSYKDRSEDRIKGLEAGANYYLAKSSFHNDTLLEAVKDLIG